MHRIAIDPGFGGYKIAEVIDGATKDRVVPSVIGRGRVDQTGLDVFGRHGRPTAVMFGDVEAIVGENVELYAAPIERTDFDMFTGGWEARSLIYAAFYRLLGAGEHQVCLIAALPVQVLERTTLRKAKDELVWLLGVHEFTVGSRQCVVSVEQILPVPQPAGAFFEWGLNEAGVWTRAKNDLTRHSVGVVDIGFNTLDLLAIQGGKVVRRFTGGEQLGVSRALSLVATEVQRQHRRRPTLRECDLAVQDYIAGETPEIAAGGAAQNVGGAVQSALDQWRGEVMAYLGEVWGSDPGFVATLGTGGGVLLLNGTRGIEVLSNPVTANARGLAKYALRDGIWK